MIIIPEIETVVILVPRTGSGSLRRTIKARYPNSMLVYRHMEADGVPLGYDRWRRVGVVRSPVARLWSLYKFLHTFGDGEYERDYPEYVAAQRASVQREFSDWIVNNQTVFTSPYDSAGRGGFWPHYSVRHPIPENRKSQFLYLRPDLGTEVYRYDEMDRLYSSLDLPATLRVNATPQAARPALSSTAHEHIKTWFAWDLLTTSFAAPHRADGGAHIVTQHLNIAGQEP